MQSHEQKASTRMMTMTITKTGDGDETMCDSHTYKNKNELRHDDCDDNNDDKDATMYCNQTNRGITEAGQCHKHQAPVYDILPSTTAVFSYAIGP